MSATVGGPLAGRLGGPVVRPLDAGPADRPFTAGWSVAAIAVHSVLQIPAPMILRLLPPGLEPIVIDFRHHAFSWSRSIKDFPASPVGVGVETEPVAPEAPALFELPGDNLDILLWNIGLASFEDTVASWLRPGDRYHLVRWPNLTTMRHTVDHMRLVALLGNGWFTVGELATAAAVTEGEACRIVNALSLMGVLENVQPEQVAAERVAAPAVRVGLVQRLRDRLGL